MRHSHIDDIMLCIPFPIPFPLSDGRLARNVGTCVGAGMVGAAVPWTKTVGRGLSGSVVTTGAGLFELGNLGAVVTGA